jgi:hypothetical protein
MMSGCRHSIDTQRRAALCGALRQVLGTLAHPAAAQDRVGITRPRTPGRAA